MKWKALVFFLLCCFFLGTAISEEAPNVLADPLSLLEYAEVTTDQGSLNMRLSPKSSGTVLKRIPNHTIVLVLEPDDDWSKIAYDGKEGYVISDYLTILEDLPYSTLEQGDHGKEVLSLKRRLQELGYFRAGATDMTASFTETMESRIKIFQRVNGLEPTGIASPELQAFIFWGNALKNDGYLPPAPYYVVGGAGNGEETDPASGLSAKITCRNTSHELISDGEEIRNYFSYSRDISGGYPPYTTVVKRLANDAFDSYTITSNPWSEVCANGGQFTAFQISLTATDSKGNSVTAQTWCSFVNYIPTEEEGEE